jgi:hypothetical protein
MGRADDLDRAVKPLGRPPRRARCQIYRLRRAMEKAR